MKVIYIAMWVLATNDGKQDDLLAANDGKQDDPLGKLNFIENTLCMACRGSGTTKMLPVTIPYFREIVVCSFECDDCGYKNNDAMFGGELQEKGVQFCLVVKGSMDLNRQIVKSDFATVLFEELEFEIPAKAHRGEVTTVEGLLSTCASRLENDQPARLRVDVDVGLKIAKVISRLRDMASGDEQVTVKIDDPSGNSFVENPSAPEKDECLKQTFYTRTPEQDIFVGLQPCSEEDEVVVRGSSVGQKNVTLEGAEELLERQWYCDNSGRADDGTNTNAMKEEAFVFPETCPGCRVEGTIQMCQVEIPHFKDVIIMSFNCPNCGYRSNEVKGGGGVPMKGTRSELTVRGVADLAREVLKSETCVVEVPDIQLVLQMGTLGSIYTTIEGLLDKVRCNLGENNPFVTGDSATQHHGITETGKKVRRFSLS